MVVRHGLGIIRYVSSVPTIPVEGGLDPVDAVLFYEPETKVALFVEKEFLVVETNLDQLIGSEHDPAGDRVILAAASLQNDLIVINEEIVACDRVHVPVLCEEGEENPYELGVDVIIRVHPHGEQRTRRSDTPVECRRQSGVHFVAQHSHLLAEQVQDLAGAIGAAIVDDYHLVVAPWKVLFHQGAEAPSEEPLLIEDRDNDRDKWNGRHDQARPFVSGDVASSASTRARRTSAGSPSSILTVTGMDTARSSRALDLGNSPQRLPP